MGIEVFAKQIERGIAHNALGSLSRKAFPFGGGKSRTVALLAKQ